MDPDAGPPADASRDAPIDAATGSSVIVHVRKANYDGTPDALAIVHHANAAGVVLSTETTGADGLVNLTVTAGDSVTVQQQAGSYTALTTIAAVEPGDELWFGPAPMAPAGQMTVTLPDVPGAGELEVRGPCIVPEGDTSTEIVVRWFDGCPATRTVIAVAREAGPNGEDLAFTATITLVNGGAVTLTGTWAAQTEVSLAVQGVDPEAELDVDGVLMSGDYATVVGDVTLDPISQTVHWHRPASFDDGVYLFAGIDGVSGGQFRSFRRLAPGATAVDLTQRVPVVTAILPTTELAWTVSAAAPIDAFYVLTSERGGKGELLADWRFVLPPDARTLVRPQLPGAPDTSFDEIAVIDVAGAGYDEYRPQAAVNFGGPTTRVPAGFDMQSWITIDGLLPP